MQVHILFQCWFVAWRRSVAASIAEAQWAWQSKEEVCGCQ